MVIPPASEGGRTTLSVVVLLSVYTDNHFFGEFAMLRMAGAPPPQTQYGDRNSRLAEIYLYISEIDFPYL
eukprot:COSAG01_NODE_311_length_19072_cov_73.511727_1_plen_70_part_00